MREVREILFRGKTDKGEWVQGDLLHPDLYGNGYSIEDFTKEKNNCCDVLPETIGQYTGLTDKNGKKIFEGDIVILATCTPREVKYCNGGFELVGTAIPFKFMYKFTIIGNIHDNPELLKGGEGDD